MKWLFLLVLPVHLCGADLMTGLNRVVVSVKSTLNSDDPSLKAVPEMSLKPFIELALQREGLIVSDTWTDSDGTGELVVSVFCMQSVQAISCMITTQLKQYVNPIRKNFETKIKGEIQYLPVLVISKLHTGMLLVSPDRYREAALTEAIQSQLTAFLNNWRKANPKP